jgi:branched-chain amino acid transport system ATP-binding protein
MAPDISFLNVQDLSVGYGAIEAVRGVSFELRRGEILCLIGANGAGKTTILKTISGLLRPRRGQITFKGETISQLPAHVIVQRGLCHTPEGRGIFLNLSVEENLDLGAWAVKDKGRFAADLERVFVLFPRLKERRKQNAGTLSGGEQQMLAIGRALMGRPECLLLDEPSLGLAPQFIERIFSVIKEINSQGVTILLVEQNASLALELAHRGLVLETGGIKMSGPAKDLLQSDDVRKAYLGE